MLPQNVKTSRLKCSFVPFFLPVYVLLSSFVYFLKIFPFCLHFLAKASLCFYNCNLLLVPLPAILPKISHKCASRASVPRGVNRKSKIHLPQSNLFGSGIMLKYQDILQCSFFCVCVYLLSINKKGHFKLKKFCKKQIAVFGMK